MLKVKVKIKRNLTEEILSVDKETLCIDLLKQYEDDNKVPIVLVKINGVLKELSTPILEDCTLELLDITDKAGMMCYIRSLQFVLIKAVNEVFPRSKVTIEHSLSKGLFGEIEKKPPLVIDDVYDIKNKMDEIIQADLPIVRKKLLRKDAIELFKAEGMEDKVSLLSTVNQEKVTIYSLGGTYDYFYGPMVYSTGQLKYYDLISYDPGFILRYPTSEAPTQIPRFVSHKKLAKIFHEAENWGNILNVTHVGALNEKIQEGDGEIVTLIRVAEALHEKKIAHIADEINKDRSIKLITIAGPSSSGKTTFCKRLDIQLRVNGLTPIPISLDDYFVNRDETPLDEFGELDFECINALDLQLFNEHLLLLMDGKEVELPSFNFKTGRREWNGNKVKLPKDGVIIIEGIHGLNNMLTEAIDDENKFKIYISPLTEINIDYHNRISTTDVRMIRRIVRDHLSRGYDVEYTLKMWPSIKRGEDKYIYPFQEEADIMFNTALIYELAVLKKYAIEELKKVKPDNPVYNEAVRLLEFLQMFKDIDKDSVPSNSLIREFIGGSCFYQY